MNESKRYTTGWTSTFSEKADFDSKSDKKTGSLLSPFLFGYVEFELSLFGFLSAFGCDCQTLFDIRQQFWLVIGVSLKSRFMPRLQGNHGGSNFRMKVFPLGSEELWNIKPKVDPVATAAGSEDFDEQSSADAMCGYKSQSGRWFLYHQSFLSISNWFRYS